MSAKQYSKKHKSEYGFQFFDHHVQQLSIRHLKLEVDLHRAIENEEWLLHYQPKFDLQQRKIVGVEALIRWNQSDIVPRIPACLEKSNVPPRLLEIEITETILMENVHQAIESLERLHARGISIAIDDFGTGYSSLSYLKTLPIDCLKIDRGFVKDICTDDNDQKIVQTLISMAHSMGMKVVAEGVEDREQFEQLRGYSVDEVQGYLLSKPVEPPAIEAMILNPQKQLDFSTNVVQLRP